MSVLENALAVLASGLEQVRHFFVVGAHPVGDVFQGDAVESDVVEVVFHAHRPRGGLLQKSHAVHGFDCASGQAYWGKGAMPGAASSGKLRRVVFMTMASKL